MIVEIFADIVCPWCYIGERRFEKGLAEFAGRDAVDVIFRPYQLDPDAPTTPTPLRAYLARRFGAMAPSVTSRVSAVGADEGITMNWDNALAVNTFEAHRLMRLARTEYGRDVQRGLMNALFAGHFTHGVDVSDHAALAAIAGTAGMAGERVRDYLESGEGRAELEIELDEARRLGVQSVPMYAFEGQYAVEGAQSADSFVKVLEEVQRRSHA